MSVEIPEHKWVKAEPCSPQQKLTETQVEQWRTQGFTMVSGLFPEALIEALHNAAQAHYPAPKTEAATDFSDFGSAGKFTFPSPTSVFNDITLHENLLNAIAALLGENVADLRLTQSDLWPKYAREDKKSIQDNSDQRIHVDYPNHTLAHPMPWHRPEAVELILYLSDVEDTGGGTAVVPREGLEDPAYRWPIVDSPGIGDLRYINDKPTAETYFAAQRPELAEWRQSLYAREKYAYFKPGDILFYRHDTWHRGTPMKPDTLRLVQNMTFRKAASEWISTLHVGWAWQAYRDNKFLEKLIACSSLPQRAVMGFPQPGSDYWCEETLTAVEARYGMFGMDMQPYKMACEG
ncbi:MAG: phytanoyl-CoA dioxygenase family protein [Pseudomonadota bacterium]